MPSLDSSTAFAVADKEIAAMIGMSLAWVRKDRATKCILPFFYIGDCVRYDVATVRKSMLDRMQGGTVNKGKRPAPASLAA
jgi:hypothetical protein